MPARPRPLLRPLCLALLCTVIASAAATTLYRWTDANGVVHWSDRPVEGAVAVQMATGGVGRAIPGPTAVAPPPVRAPASSRYTRLEVLQPQPGADLFDTAGTVQCQIELTPVLQNSDALWCELDGARHSNMAGSVMLPVVRGEHTLRALVTDRDGAELISSATVTFTVHQHSVATPPVGPLLVRPH